MLIDELVRAIAADQADPLDGIATCATDAATPCVDEVALRVFAHLVAVDTIEVPACDLAEEGRFAGGVDLTEELSKRRFIGDGSDLVAAGEGELYGDDIVDVVGG